MKDRESAERIKDCFGEGAKTNRRGACAPRSFECFRYLCFLLLGFIIRSGDEGSRAVWANYL